MKRFIDSIFLPLCLWFAPAAQGQIVDTSIQIETVLISQDRLSAFNLGNRTKVIDSTLLQLYQSKNLSDVLSQAGVYIRNYGPGRLATTSFRGGSAAHTAILWNGVPIQNVMLGQSDFALIPAKAANEVRLDFGSSSALWGSGAVGGSIHLRHQAKFDEGLKLGIHSSIGSFQQYQNSFSAKYSTEKFSTDTRIIYHDAENNYTYQDFENREKELSNAAIENLALFQDFSLKLNPKQQLNAHIWYQNTDRQIPPLRSQLVSAAHQQDEQFRTLVDWNYLGETLALKARSAFMTEQLIYNDSIASIYSDSKINSYITELEARIYPSPAHSINIGWHGSLRRALSTGYAENQSQDRAALFFSWRFKDQTSRLNLVTNLRQEIVQGQWTPFTPSLGAEWLARKHFKIRAKVARSFRLPTLNDLYWNPGGNPDLLPEQGWSQDLGLEYEHQQEGQQWNFSGSLFNRTVDNWIIWLPNGAFWSPSNIRRVWSRGLETGIQWTYSTTAWQLYVNSEYQFVRSTNIEVGTTNSAAEGKQLIYTPKHQWNNRVLVQFGHWKLTYTHLYTGSVYLLADNSESLPAFQVGDVSLQKIFDLQSLKIDSNFTVYNLWNADYEVVVNRPMPGRWLELQLGFTFKRR